MLLLSTMTLVAASFAGCVVVDAQGIIEVCVLGDETEKVDGVLVTIGRVEVRRTMAQHVPATPGGPTGTVETTTPSPALPLAQQNATPMKSNATGARPIMAGAACFEASEESAPSPAATASSPASTTTAGPTTASPTTPPTTTAPTTTYGGGAFRIQQAEDRGRRNDPLADEMVPEEGWQILVDIPRTLNLANASAEPTLVGRGPLREAEYREIRLTIDEVWVVASAETAKEVEVRNEMVRLGETWNVSADEVTRLILDVDLDASLGQSGSNWTFEPVIHLLVQEDAATPTST